MEDYLLTLTTVPTEQVGHDIAKRLVEERLAACVTITAGCQSYYWWEGKMTQDQEFVLFIKTKSSLYSKLETRVKELHPYSVPEIVAISISRGSEKYFNWVDSETKS